MSSAPTSSVPPPIVAISGWILPGAGYWLLGQRARALVVGITILILFFLGLLVGGIRVVDPPDFNPRPAGERAPREIEEHIWLSPTRTMGRIVQKPWFIGQVLAGPVALLSAVGSTAAAASPNYRDIVSHARVNEIGTLYTAVAGMLNLLAIIDAAYRAARPDPTQPEPSPSVT